MGILRWPDRHEHTSRRRPATSSLLEHERQPRPTPVFLCFLSLLAAWAAAFADEPDSPAPVPQWTPPAEQLLAHARRLLREVPLIDGHNDLPTTGPLHRSNGDWSSVTLASGDARLKTDIPRLEQGQLGAQFWAAFVEQQRAGAGASYYQQSMHVIETIKDLTRRYPEIFEFATTADDIERIHARGRIACLIGLEGGHLIENSLEKLRAYYAAGVRYLTLAHVQSNDWADSATDAALHHGLTDFGREVIAEMNRLGMLVDLSHASEETAQQALQASRAPVIFSHSAAAALNPHPRNVSDETLRLLAKNGGVIMVNFSSDFIAPQAALYAQQRALATQGMTPEQRIAWRDAHPAPRGDVGDVANHIDHLVKIAGVDHVGIGSDFDGAPLDPVGLADVSQYPNLIAELLRRGYRDRDIERIAGLNILRVMRAATAPRMKGRASSNDPIQSRRRTPRK